MQMIPFFNDLKYLLISKALKLLVFFLKMFPDNLCLIQTDEF